VLSLSDFCDIVLQIEIPFWRKLGRGQPMDTIRFSSEYHDGVIRVPSEYASQISEKVDVIVMNRQAKTRPLNGKQFLALSVKTQGYRFNREEANER
jgi:hypothetical protein